MRIKKLSLKNFRGFEELEIDFPDGEGGLAVFIGVNGSGKSSVLDSISYLLLNYLNALTSVDSETTVKEVGFHKNINLSSNESINKLIFHYNKSSYLSEFIIKKSRPDKGRNLITKRFGDIFSFDNALPILAYYNTERHVSKSPSLKAKNLNKLLIEFFEIYPDDLIDFNVFFEWFRNTEDFENERRLYKDDKFRHKGLTAIRNSISIFLGKIKAPRVQRQPTEELVFEKENRIYSISQLSHGEKLVFALIGDIIRRLSITNPKLENPCLAEGIVMIDEIELHLHPSWQRTIIPNLRKTFPNIQFIVTTHSPQVLSNVPKENVFILEDFKLVEKTPPTLGRDTNSILYDLFGVEERPEKAKEEFQKLYKLIDNPDAEELAKSMLNEMEIKYGTEDAEIVRAKLHLEFLTR